MFKRLGLILLVLVIAVVIFTFTAQNRGLIDVDLGYTRVTTSIPVAFTVTFALGWLFGVICMAFFAVRLINERRTLRRSLRITESEVSSLRSLPLTDAD